MFLIAGIILALTDWFPDQGTVAAVLLAVGAVELIIWALALSSFSSAMSRDRRFGAAKYKPPPSPKRVRGRRLK